MNMNMSRRGSKRVSFSPDIYDNPAEIPHKHKHGSRIVGKKMRLVGIVNVRVPKMSSFSPVRLLRSVASAALRFVSITRRRSSSKVSSPNMGRSRSYTCQVESHHTEAIEDCIEFINSSSANSLQRSNSVSVDSWN